MGQFSLPEHLVEWCETQIALGRVASIGTYLAQLISEDRLRLDALVRCQEAIAEARDSGISMRDPESVLAQWMTVRANSRLDALRDAIRQGREGGYSMASLDGILSRAIGTELAQAA